jgi:undecaprenyl-diphosphatase
MIAATQIGVPLMVLAVALPWWEKVVRYHLRHAALSAGLAFVLGRYRENARLDAPVTRIP